MMQVVVQLFFIPTARYPLDQVEQQWGKHWFWKRWSGSKTQTEAPSGMFLQQYQSTWCTSSKAIHANVEGCGNAGCAHVDHGGAGSASAGLDMQQSRRTVPLCYDKCCSDYQGAAPVTEDNNLVSAGV